MRGVVKAEMKMKTKMETKMKTKRGEDGDEDKERRGLLFDVALGIGAKDFDLVAMFGHFL